MERVARKKRVEQFFSLWQWLILLGILLGTINLVGNAFSFNDTRTREQDQLQSQVENCHKVGDPLISAVTSMLQDQIAQTDNADLQQFFPNIPPEQLKQLIAESQAKRIAILDTLDTVPSCETRFK